MPIVVKTTPALRIAESPVPYRALPALPGLMLDAGMHIVLIGYLLGTQQTGMLTRARSIGSNVAGCSALGTGRDASGAGSHAVNFQQLRYIRAAVEHNFNLTEVAERLFTSQSGVSKQIKELEAELKTDIFVRRGKRLTGLTKAGEDVAPVIERLLNEAENLKRLSERFAQDHRGRLVVAATHNQASYVLPPLLARFSRRYPDVEVELRQGTPRYVTDLLLKGEADIGLATEAVDDYPELQTFACFTWDHVVIVPTGHPLAADPAPTLADIAGHPIVTYTPGFSGRSQIDEAFAAAGLAVDVRMTAMDAEAIKTYVRLGLGVGIIAQMALHNGVADGLVAIGGASRFFRPNTTKVAILKGMLLRNYAYSLIEMCAPQTATVPSRGKPSAAPCPPLRFSERADLHAATVAQ